MTCIGLVVTLLGSAGFLDTNLLVSPTRNSGGIWTFGKRSGQIVPSRNRKSCYNLIKCMVYNRPQP